MIDPDDTMQTEPPDPVISTIPSPPPDFEIDWDGFSSDELEDA
jgi:hypothetical protein